MSHNTHNQKLKALPVQLLDLADGLLVKRGCTEFKISGGEARPVLERILSAACDNGATREQIVGLFPTSARSIIAELIEQLRRRQILVYGDGTHSGNGDVETSLDIFYWHFGQHSQAIANKLASRHFAVLGITSISRQLAYSLSALNLRNFEIIDYPMLRNLRLFDETGRLKPEQWPSPLKLPQPYEKWMERPSFDCLIATSDFGFTPTLNEWNRFCVEQGRDFLPLVLHNLVGHIGPLVIPGETACFECLRARQNAHMRAPDVERAAEREAFGGQIVVGFHPSMTAVIGEIAAFELTRFYGGAIPKQQVGTLIEVNLLDTHVKACRVLKVPRCPVCSPLNKRASVTPYKSVFTVSSGDDP